MITNLINVPASEVTSLDYDIHDGILVWMDGGGSNAYAINDQLRKPDGTGIVSAIATTRTATQGSSAHERAEELGKINGTGKLPVIEFDAPTFERDRGVSPEDYLQALDFLEIAEKLERTRNTSQHIILATMMNDIGDNRIKSPKHPNEIVKVREELCDRFGEKIIYALKEAGLPENLAMFAAGGKTVFAGDFLNSRPIDNMHPGRLNAYTLRGKKGRTRDKRPIVGNAWVPSAKALAMGEPYLCSSMHQMTAEMDQGSLRMLGYKLHVDYNYLLGKLDMDNLKVQKSVGKIAQDILKYIGDHVIAGATYMDMFNGNWGVHDSGMLVYRMQDEWCTVPNGITIEDHVKNNPETPFQRDNVFLENKTYEFHDRAVKVGGK